MPLALQRELLFSPLERRRHQRLFVSLPIHYQTWHPESGEIHRGCGVIRDISLSGSYFHLEHEARFQPGQILSLTIDTTMSFLDIDSISCLQAEGEVIRLEPRGLANPCFGVAVTFLENLSFTSA